MFAKEVAAAVSATFESHGTLPLARITLPQTWTSDDKAMFAHSYSEVMRLHTNNVYTLAAVRSAMVSHSLTAHNVQAAAAYMALSCFAKPADLYRALKDYVKPMLPPQAPARTIATPVAANSRATIATNAAIAATLPAQAPAPAASGSPLTGLTWAEARKLTPKPAFFSWQRANNVPAGTSLVDSDAAVAAQRAPQTPAPSVTTPHELKLQRYMDRGLLPIGSTLTDMHRFDAKAEAAFLARQVQAVVPAPAPTQALVATPTAVIAERIAAAVTAAIVPAITTAITVALRDMASAASGPVAPAPAPSQPILVQLPDGCEELHDGDCPSGCQCIDAQDAAAFERNAQAPAPQAPAPVLGRTPEQARLAKQASNRKYRAKQAALAAASGYQAAVADMAAATTPPTLAAAIAKAQAPAAPAQAVTARSLYTKLNAAGLTPAQLEAVTAAIAGS